MDKKRLVDGTTALAEKRPRVIKIEPAERPQNVRLRVAAYARLSILFARRIQHLPLFFMHIALSGGKTTVAIPNKGICPTT